MKLINTLTILLMAVFLLASCGGNFTEGEEVEEDGLIVKHKEVENEFIVTEPSDGYYNTGDTIKIKVKHSFKLTVTGTPRIKLTFDSGTKYATYSSGSGSKTLTFKYVIVAGDEATDGITVASSISLNSGTIKFRYDGSNVNAETDIDIDDTDSVKIDTTAPTVTLIVPPADATYYYDQTIRFKVTYDEAIYVTGSPRFAFDLSGTTKYASYVLGSGTQILTFEYDVAAADTDANGIDVISPVSLNGGKIKDRYGNNAVSTFTVALYDSAITSILIDGDTPFVNSVTPPTIGTYEPGEFFTFKLNFSEAVTVVGSPRVELDIGGESAYATYLSGSGTAALTFKYIVVSGDDDEDGIGIAAAWDDNSSSATIRDADTNDAVAAYDVPATPNVIVDGAIPEVTTIVVNEDADDDDWFVEDEDIIYTVTFTQTVTVTNLPRLVLTLESEDPTNSYAVYSSGSGTTSLNFVLTVPDAVEDTDGIAIDTDIDLNSTGLIQNSAGSNADLDMTDAITAFTATVYVDSIDPVVTIDAPPIINAANASAYTFTGTCTTGDGDITYTVSSPSGGTDVTADVACTTGTWTSGSIDVSGLTDDAAVEFDAEQTDAVDNTGNATQVTELKDVVLPVVGIDAPAVINDANKSSETFTGTCTTGDGDVTYTISSPSGGADVTADVSCTTGTWTTGAIDVSGLSDDTDIEYDAEQTDSANNTGDATQATEVKDVVFPVVGIDAPAIINDANKSAATFTGTCTAGDGNVTYTISSPSGGADVTNSVACGGGTWTTGAIDVSGLSDDAAVEYDAEQTDDAGNKTDATQDTELKDVVLPVVGIDAPSEIAMANESAFTVTGTCTIGDGDVTYTISSPSGGADVTADVSCSGGGTWTTGSVDVSGLTDDTDVEYDAEQTDSANNTGDATQVTELKDSTAPVVGVDAPAVINDANKSSETFTGTCTAGDGNVTYTISSPSGGADVTASVACGGGTWTTGAIDVSGLSDDTDIEYDAEQTDAAGNTGDATQVTEVKDIVYPVVGVDAPSDIIVANESAFTATGTCTTGDGNVTYTISSPSGGADVTASVACGGGTWTTGSIDVSGLTDDAAVEYDAEQTDDAGNKTDATQDTGLKDATAPVVGIDAPSDITAVNEGAYTVTGTCTTGDGNVTYTISSPSGGADVTNSVACGGGTWTTGSIDVSGLTDDTAVEYDAEQTDSATNTGDATQDTAVKDTTAPSVAIDAPSVIYSGNESSFTVTGTCSNGDGNVTYTISSPSGGADSTASVACSGTWTTGAIDVSALNDDGAIEFDAEQTDAYSNTGDATQKTEEKDVVSPTISSTTINAGSFEETDILTLSVTYNDDVTVTGTPTIPITFDTGSGNASYNSGTSSSTVLKFDYTIAAGDDDSGTIVLGSMDLTGDSIEDGNGNDTVNTGLDGSESGSIDTVAPSGLTYTGSPFTYNMGLVMTALSVNTITGNNIVYTVSPALPGGMNLNSGTGQITGTPTTITANTTYTITATNNSGNTDVDIDIEIDGTDFSKGGDSETIGSTAIDVSKTYTTTNDGGLTSQTITVTFTPDDGSYWTQGVDNCDTNTVGAAASCNVAINFLGATGNGSSPVSGNYTATITVDDGTDSVTYNLTATIP